MLFRSGRRQLLLRGSAHVARLIELLLDVGQHLAGPIEALLRACELLLDGQELLVHVAAICGSAVGASCLRLILGLQPLPLAILVAALYVLVFLVVTLWTLRIALEGYQRRSDEAMVDLALAVASQIDMAGHETLLRDAQTGSPEYLRLLAPLEQMHLAMHDVRGVYTKRIGADGDMVYVLDTAQSSIESLRERATAVTRVGQRVPIETIEPGQVSTVLSGKPWLDAESFVEGGVRLRSVFVPLRGSGGDILGMLGIDFEEEGSRSVGRRWARDLALPGMGALGLVAGLLGLLVLVLRRELGSVLVALREESLRDGLTALFNRRQFGRSLAQHVDLATRTARPLGLMLLDVDHFKSINDALGHPGGDRVLVGIAEALAGGARSEDIACRIGGEEFALILPGTDAAQALIVYERIASRIRRPLDERGDIGLELSVSAGIATLLPGETAEGFMLRADRALYSAKRAGRDRIEVAAGVVPA